MRLVDWSGHLTLPPPDSPSGYLSVPFPLSPEQAAELRERWLLRANDPPVIIQARGKR